jgi:competence protein ComGC
MQMKNEKGFTLIEMMIVLFIITILLMITIPNVAKNNANISNKGCEGMKRMVESQVQAYYVDRNQMPNSISQLVQEGYLDEAPKCPDGKEVVLVDGEVEIGGQ